MVGNLGGFGGHSRPSDRTHMGTTFIYEEIKAGRFPRSIRIGRLAPWTPSEVQGWIRQQIAQNRPLQVDGQTGG
ncbi:AlpA family phage regulatory protein [Stenotrophomonas maltophilia]|nr:AlpA family phage regulatory protein [Stenotrophomonas maltophilia]